MGEQLNFFEQTADRQMVAPAKARARAREKRAAKLPGFSPQEKKLREDAKQARRYRAHRRSLLREHWTGRYRDGWSELRRALRSLSLEDSEKILDHIRAADWLLGADPETRQLALSVIASSIVRLRERNGLEPFDDALPHEDPTVFEIIRSLLISRRREPDVDSTNL